MQRGAQVGNEAMRVFDQIANSIKKVASSILSATFTETVSQRNMDKARKELRETMDSINSLIILCVEALNKQ